MLLTSLLEAAKDDPNGIGIMWSFISAIAQYGYLDLVSNPMALARLDPQLWASLVKSYGEAGARSLSTKVLNAIFKFDQRTLPVGQVSKVTYAGLLLSCAEAIRGACDLVVNVGYAGQESYEAWIAPDFKGSVPGCSKSTAVAVTDYTYVLWDGAAATFDKCVSSCRTEQDSCGGDTQKACYWWNACVNYCASDKLGTLASPRSRATRCNASRPPRRNRCPCRCWPRRSSTDRRETGTHFERAVLGFSPRAWPPRCRLPRHLARPPPRRRPR